MASSKVKMPRGVTALTRSRGGRSFRASIRHQGKDYPLGIYEHLWDAALAYNIASEAIGRGARTPNEIPLDHRAPAETVRQITSKVRSRLGLVDPVDSRDDVPPSDSSLVTLLEISITGFWRGQALHGGADSVTTSANRILEAARMIFWDRHPSFREEILAEMVVRRLNATFRKADLARVILEDDGDDLFQLAWWLAVPDHVDGLRGFREEVEYRYSSHFDSEAAVSMSWAELLGITPPFSIDQVKRAYRSRSRQAHPDGGGSNKAFVRLNRAYQEALSFLGITRKPSP